MSPRILLSAALRALPVVGPFLRRIDRLEVLFLLHEAQIDLLSAKAGVYRPERTTWTTTPASRSSDHATCSSTSETRTDS